MFTTKVLYDVLNKECYRFCVILSIKNLYFRLQHWVIGILNKEFENVFLEIGWLNFMFIGGLGL
jgi:hypothetical protein